MGLQSPVDCKLMDDSKSTALKICEAIEAGCGGASSAELAALEDTPSSVHIRSIWIGKANPTLKTIAQILDAAEELNPGAIARLAHSLSPSRVRVSELSDRELVELLSKVSAENERRSKTTWALDEAA